MRQLLKWTAELVVVSLTAAIAARPPVVTVCEALHDRLVLHQTDVFVVGRLTNTEEGSWLISKCDFAVVSGRYTWDQSIWADPAPKGERAGLEWDKSALLARMPRGTVSGEVELSTERELPFAWAAVYGRFKTRLNPRFRWVPRAKCPALASAIWECQ